MPYLHIYTTDFVEIACIELSMRDDRQLLLSRSCFQRCEDSQTTSLSCIFSVTVPRYQHPWSLTLLTTDSHKHLTLPFLSTTSYGHYIGTAARVTQPHPNSVETSAKKPRFDKHELREWLKHYDIDQTSTCGRKACLGLLSLIPDELFGLLREHASIYGHFDRLNAPESSHFPGMAYDGLQ